MARYAEARRLCAERSYAMTGTTRGEVGDEFYEYVDQPRAMAQRLFSGLLEGEDLEEALTGIANATENAFRGLARADDQLSMLGTLYVMMAQNVTLGMLLGRMIAQPRGGGASQEPSGDFDGATE